MIDPQFGETTHPGRWVPTNGAYATLFKEERGVFTWSDAMFPAHHILTPIPLRVRFNPFLMGFVTASTTKPLASAWSNIGVIFSEGVPLCTASLFRSAHL